MSLVPPSTPLSRRSFLKLGGKSLLALVLSGLSASPLLAALLPKAWGDTLPTTTPTQEKVERCTLKIGETLSGTMLQGLPLQAKPFEARFKKVRSLSGKLLKQHEALYHNYVAKYNGIREQLQSLTQAAETSLSGVNTTFHPYRELLLEQSFALNGALLHEAYFGNLGGSQREPSETMSHLLSLRWGSVANFRRCLVEAGKAMRGWVIVGYQAQAAQLAIFGMDAHNEGLPAGVLPILVLDVYEHAYALDYGTQRLSYLDALWNDIAWDVVENRLATALQQCEAQSLPLFL